MLHPMAFAPLPETASWQHQGLRTGFEAAYFKDDDGASNVEGCTTAVEDGRPWIVHYALSLDTTLSTRRASVSGRSPLGRRSTLLEARGDGSWRVDGVPAPHLDGCLDVDLESSALTNAFPVHRLALSVGDRAAAPAAYVRADLSIERLEQDYLRDTDHGSHQRYRYAAPAFAFTCSMLYDESGLVLEYPGIATRSS
jgi:uncharacterized protein